jgi:uncharacterized protein (TIGR02678 family)
VIGAGVRDTDLGAYQRAVRALLVHPLVTAVHPDRDTLRLVRRFAPDLSSDLAEVAGYRLVLSATCARLVKPVDLLDPTQETRLPGKRPFDRRRYAYLALALGSLGRAGSQVALSELAAGLRRRAADVDGLGFDSDEYRHRLAFVDVVVHLESIGALTVVEGTAASYVKEESADALYDVDREVVHQLFAPPRIVQHVGSAGDLLAGDRSASRDARRAATRQRVSRLLLELPVVYFDEVDSGDRAYLQNQARTLGADLTRLTGGQLERRAEGLALVDATGGFSDRRFPAGGTPSQVALLLAALIADQVGTGSAETVVVAGAPNLAERTAALVAGLDRCRPVSESGSDDDGSTVRLADDPPDLGAPAAGPFLRDGFLREQVERLVVSYGPTFAADLRTDQTALLHAAVEVLETFGLIRRVPGGVVARPAIARYRRPELVGAGGAQLSLLDSGAPS